MTPLWQPSTALRESCRLTHFIGWLREKRGLKFDDYDALWRWSVENLDAFWAAIWDYFEIQSATPYTQVLAQRTMPGAQWFPGATLNYTQHIFRNASPDRPALLARSETHGIGRLRETSWADLERDVRRFASGLRRAGLQQGDRVAAYLPNIAEAVVAFLATASLGAIWSSCSPDMGAGSVLDRLQQIQPKVFIAVDGYVYKGKAFERRSIVAEIEAKLTSLEHSILVPYLDAHATPAASTATLQRRIWSDFLGDAVPLDYTAVPFDHPLWVLYSSGTTGLPKPIVHGTGGILLEHLKALSLHLNLGPDSRFFWFTTTGWMMWNYLVGGLLVGSPIVLYDGSPAAPDLGALWRLADDAGITCFGTSAAYIAALMSADYRPREHHSLKALVSLGSTGSPLSPEGFDWVYENVKRDLWLASVSGGTDVCAAFVGGNPLLPVYRGELQGRCLGCKVEAFDNDGVSIRDQVGELVVTEPMPSMPIGFWNDPDGKRYRESYFEMYPGIWRHGDWIKITSAGGVCIFGRSDSTINRHGIRVGTSEIYSAVEAVPGVVDSLVIDLEMLGRNSYMPLFVVLAPGVTLDDALKGAINSSIRAKLSARQLPDEIFAIPEVPRTLNGKKMEVPIKKILLGTPADKAVSAGSMSNPDSLRYFTQFKK